MALSDDQKKRIQDAIQSSQIKNQPKVGPTKTYGSPEKELEKEVLTWLRSQSFHIQVYEAKATYSPQAGRWIQQSMKAGTVDLMGNDKAGRGVFIELKAPGRRSTLRENQREFLMHKIETNCFAVCIDSLELLQNQLERWLMHINRNQHALAQDFLRAALPKVKAAVDDGPLFGDEE